MKRDLYILACVGIILCTGMRFFMFMLEIDLNVQQKHLQQSNKVLIDKQHELVNKQIENEKLRWEIYRMLQGKK